MPDQHSPQEREIEILQKERESLHGELARLLDRTRTPRKGVTANDFWIAAVAETLGELEGQANFHRHNHEEAETRANRAEAALREAAETLAFYADPDTYFAIGFMGDSPCGDFLGDLSTLPGHPARPGKRARAALLIAAAALDTSIGDREPEAECERCGDHGVIFAIDADGPTPDHPCSDCKPPAPCSDPKEQLDDVLLEQAAALALEDGDESVPSGASGDWPALRIRRVGDDFKIVPLPWVDGPESRRYVPAESEGEQG